MADEKFSFALQKHKYLNKHFGLVYSVNQGCPNFFLWGPERSSWKNSGGHKLFSIFVFNQNCKDYLVFSFLLETKHDGSHISPGKSLITQKKCFAGLPDKKITTNCIRFFSGWSYFSIFFCLPFFWETRTAHVSLLLYFDWKAQVCISVKMVAFTNKLKQIKSKKFVLHLIFYILVS